jgi:hypothetical protein
MKNIKILLLFSLTNTFNSMENNKTLEEKLEEEKNLKELEIFNYGVEKTSKLSHILNSIEISPFPLKNIINAKIKAKEVFEEIFDKVKEDSKKKKEAFELSLKDYSKEFEKAKKNYKKAKKDLIESDSNSDDYNDLENTLNSKFSEEYNNYKVKLQEFYEKLKGNEEIYIEYNYIYEDLNTQIQINNKLNTLKSIEENDILKNIKYDLIKKIEYCEEIINGQKKYTLEHLKQSSSRLEINFSSYLKSIEWEK